MKKFSSHLQFLCHVAAGIFLVSTAASAYSLLDKSEMKLDLPPGWKLIDIKRNPGMIVSSYSKLHEDTKQSESLVAVDLTKEPNKDPYATITEMTKNVKQQALSQHCEAEELVSPSEEDTNQFRTWSQTFQCKPSRSAIIQLYVDADPHTIYLITYTNPNYPFAPDQRTVAKELLKNSVLICYKGQGCSGVSN